MGRTRWSRCAAVAAWARERSSSAPEVRRAVAAGILIAAVASLAACGGSDDSDAARVTRIVDGDTLVVSVDGRDEKVRLIGIDTPETVDPRKPVQCFGKEASRRMADLLPPGSAVRLERDAELRDRYGRLLAYVFRSSDGVFVNEAMVADGYAHTLTIPPNVAYAERFSDAQRTAREADKGLWSACPHE
jgi:micrococcal nuclease